MIKFKKLIAGLTLGVLSVGMGVGVIHTENVDIERADAVKAMRWLPTNSIAAGDQVLLVNTANSVQLGDIDYYGAMVSYKETPDATLNLLTVGAGSAAGKFTFKLNDTTTDYYLGLKEKKNKLQKITPTASDNAETVSTYEWTVDLSDKTNAIIKSCYDTTRTIRFNKGNTRFACYSSGQSSVQLLKLQETEIGLATGIKIDKTYSTVKLGTTLQLNATVTPSDALDKTVTWTTSDSKVATVSDGLINPVATGVTTITATSNANNKLTITSTIVVTNHAGTESDPFDVIDALEVALSTKLTPTEYYIKGKVSEIASVGKELKGTLTDSSTKTIELFKIKNIGDADFNAATAEDVQVGFDVIVKSQLGNYKSNPQIQYGFFTKITNPNPLGSISIDGNVKADQILNLEWNFAELTINAHYGTDKIIDVTNKATITYTPAKPITLGKQDVTMKADFGGKSVTKTISVNVRELGKLVKETIDSTLDFTTKDTGSSSYKNYAGTSKTTSAKFAGNFVVNKTEKFLQIRNESSSGIVINQTGGKRVHSISVNIKSNDDVVNVYGSKTAFKQTSGAELYSNSNLVNLGLFQSGETKTIIIPGDYQYIGLRPDGSTQVTSIVIEWELYTAAEIASEIKTMASGWDNKVDTGATNCANNYKAAKELVLTLQGEEMNLFKTSKDAEILNARTTYEHWCNVNHDVTPYAGDIIVAANNGLLSYVEDYNNLIIVVVAISILAISSIAILAIAKRKKATR